MSRKSKELRGGERFTDSSYEPYARAIGQLVLSWNDLHEKLALIFAAILSHPDRKRIPKKHKVNYEFRELERLAGIWNSTQFDRPKREMLRGILIPLVLDDLLEMDIATDAAKTDILWILEHADKLEDFRNNAVHSPLIRSLADYDVGPLVPPPARFLAGLGIKGRDITPNVLMQNRPALKIAQKKSNEDFLRETIWARDATIVLRDFALRIYWALLYEPARWPRRPSLPNLGQRKSRQSRPRPAPAK